MSDEIKEKADQVRLKLLQDLHELVASGDYQTAASRLSAIEDAAQLLNALEPHRCGVGSHIASELLKVRPAQVVQADAATPMAVTGEAMTTEPGQALKAAAADAPVIAIGTTVRLHPTGAPMIVTCTTVRDDDGAPSATFDLKEAAAFLAQNAPPASEA